MFFLFFWFLIHMSSDMVGSLLFKIGAALNKNLLEAIVLQDWLLCSIHGLLWEQHLQKREYCLVSFLGLFSYFVLPFSFAFMGGTSCTRHCYIILPVRIQGTTSPFIFIIYTFSWRMKSWWWRSSFRFCLNS